MQYNALLEMYGQKVKKSQCFYFILNLATTSKFLGGRV